MRAVHLSIAPQHVRPERVSTAFVLLHPASTDPLGLYANKYVLKERNSERSQRQNEGKAGGRKAGGGRVGGVKPATSQ